uniref:Ig-like domain-containing protein n=1 Tax=Fundulus heteroclitus TaxID=8078 RepID=A0A3Q2NU92_FUNHE
MYRHRSHLKRSDLCCSDCHAKIRSRSHMEMFEGDFILLLCNYPTFNLDQPKVVWTRSGLSPSTVHKLQLEGDPLKDQNQLYRGRTFMETDALETGELNLNLTNLQLSDTGTYTCSIQDFREEQRVTDIELLVKGHKLATVLKRNLELCIKCIMLEMHFLFKIWGMSMQTKWNAAMLL